jgi:hypothetical protein
MSSVVSLSLLLGKLHIAEDSSRRSKNKRIHHQTMNKDNCGYLLPFWRPKPDSGPSRLELPRPRTSAAKKLLQPNDWTSTGRHIQTIIHIGMKCGGVANIGFDVRHSRTYRTFFDTSSSKT